MAEAAAAAVLWLTEGEVILTAFEAFAIATSVELVAAAAYNNYAKRRAREKMRQAHNASLRDRYVMGRATISERRIVLGRQRVSGNLCFLKSFGADLSKITGVLPLSAEEIDAVEAIYFDDEQIIVDGSGNITGVNRREFFTINSAGATFELQTLPLGSSVSAVASYGTSTLTLGVSVSGKNVTVSGASSTLSGQVTISYRPNRSPYTPAGVKDDSATLTTNGSGAGSVVLAHTPKSGSVKVVSQGSGAIDEPTTDVTSLASISGTTVSLSGAANTTAYLVSYQYTENSRARVRIFTGAPGQVADAALIAALPGVWTSAHVGNGIAYLVFEFDYDPDSFPGGLPNISALVRGSKVYDPRTGVTQWSQNPSLLARHVAMHPLGGRLAAARVHDDSFIAAANLCDVSTNYVVGGRTYTRPRYTAGLMFTSGTRADDVIQDLCEAMGGERCFTDGQLRVKAGGWATPVPTLDESWLLKEGAPIQSQRRRPVEEIANIITGAFVDEENDYQVRDFPTIRSSTYIAEDGEELPEDIDFNAITFSAQAQQVAAQRMRRKRYGRRLSVTCNYRAFGVEWGDTIYVNLPTRFGFVNLPCEVLSVSFTIDGGINLALEEIGPEIWAVSASYAEVQLRPNVFSPSPLEVPDVAGFTVSKTTSNNLRDASGEATQRFLAKWTAPTDAGVLASGGGTEIRYGLASWAENQWVSVKVESPLDRVYIEDLRQGLIYLLKARHYNALLAGQWTPFALQSAVPSSANASYEGVDGYTAESTIAATYGESTTFLLGVYGLLEFTLTQKSEVTVVVTFRATATSTTADTFERSFFIVLRNSATRFAGQRAIQALPASSTVSRDLKLTYTFTLNSGTYFVGMAADSNILFPNFDVDGDVLTQVQVRHV